MPGRRTPYSHSKSAVSIAPAAYTAGATGTTVDRLYRGTVQNRLQFFASAMLTVVTGTVTDGTHAVKLQHSDDGAAWEDVPARDLQGGNISVGAANGNTTADQGYTGHKRYLRAVSTVTGATTGGTYAAVILLDSPDCPPVDR